MPKREFIRAVPGIRYCSDSFRPGVSGEAIWGRLMRDRAS